MTNKEFYLQSFREVENILIADDMASLQLEIAVGEFQDCVFIKLYKTAWANPSPNLLTSPSRIFFSVWINYNDSSKLYYNIHALKLRHLKGYKIESRKFADKFRTAFKPFEKVWPNVSTIFGPLTLMQGYCSAASLKPIALKLCRNFISIHHLVDETLEAFSVK